MLCKKPITTPLNLIVGCGQCLGCRVNKRRLWTHRIMLELSLHENSTFATLTYSDEKLPEDHSLKPHDVRDWLKRLRSTYENETQKKIRYYLVGEYGDKTQRPHYHVILFGYPNCLYGLSQYSKQQTTCCPPCEEIKRSWGKGNIFLGQVTKASSQYVCGYVVKKMTAKTDPRLNGRYPEFARMSLKPGIGADYMKKLLDIITSEHGVKILERLQDVPQSIMYDGKEYPLGKYLRKKLRELYGMSETNATPETIEAFRQKCKLLWQEAKNKGLKWLIEEKYQTKQASLEKRLEIYQKEKKL